MKLKEKEISNNDAKIIEYIKNNEKQEYENIIKQDNTIETILALSNIRENIVKWYSFKENSSVLEIGANFGEITSILCEKVSKVVALETSKEKRDAILERNKEKTNLNVIKKIDEIKEKFDYITLIGIENITDNPQEILEEIKKYLNPQGIILLATDNKLGMKYFNKYDEEEGNVTNLVDKKLYTLREIEEQIKQAGYLNFKRYFPMTDYKLTNVIYTDNNMLSKNTLSRNIIYNNSEDTIRFYEQNNVYRELLEEDKNMFKIFCNSFLLEIFNGEYVENEIRLIAFSNMRKTKYRIQTVMEKEFVYKCAGGIEAKEHIENIKENIEVLKRSNLNSMDTYNDEAIISKYTESLTLDKVLINLMQENQKEETIQIIKRWKQELLNKLEKADEEENIFDKYKIDYQNYNIQDMTWIKNGLWDLIFQNCFYIDNEFYFYDQEWKEKNIPIEFIFYRAIKYFDRIKRYITEDELYEIMEIKKEHIQLFDEIDNKLQEEIRDKTIWKINTQGKTLLDVKREKLTLQHNINLLNMEINDKNNIIITKDNEIQELKKQIQEICESRSWKITQPLRNLGKLGNKDLNNTREGKKEK